MNNELVKWGASAVFSLALLGGGYVIYHAGSTTPSDAVSTNVSTPVSATVEPAMADKAAKGQAAPAQVVSPTDLTSAVQSLDSSNIDSATSDLEQNNLDLAAF